MLFSLNFVENVLNGRRIRFCEDPWMGDKPLCEQFSRLYNLTFSTNIMVSDVFQKCWSIIWFRRALRG